RSIKPVVEGVLASVALSGSSVVRKFRGKALASVRSMSQISTRESAGCTGRCLGTTVIVRKTAGEKAKQNVPNRPPGKRAIKFIWAGSPRGGQHLWRGSDFRGSA